MGEMPSSFRELKLSGWNSGLIKWNFEIKDPWLENQFQIEELEGSKIRGIMCGISLMVFSIIQSTVSAAQDNDHLTLQFGVINILPPLIFGLIAITHRLKYYLFRFIFPLLLLAYLGLFTMTPYLSKKNASTPFLPYPGAQNSSQETSTDSLPHSSASISNSTGFLMLLLGAGSFMSRTILTILFALALILVEISKSSSNQWTSTILFGVLQSGLVFGQLVLQEQRRKIRFLERKREHCLKGILDRVLPVSIITASFDFSMSRLIFGAANQTAVKALNMVSELKFHGFLEKCHVDSIEESTNNSIITPGEFDLATKRLNGISKHLTLKQACKEILIKRLRQQQQENYQRQQNRSNQNKRNSQKLMKKGANQGLGQANNNNTNEAVRGMKSQSAETNSKEKLQSLMEKSRISFAGSTVQAQSNNYNIAMLNSNNDFQQARSYQQGQQQSPTHAGIPSQSFSNPLSQPTATSATQSELNQNYPRSACSIFSGFISEGEGVRKRVNIRIWTYSFIQEHVVICIEDESFKQQFNSYKQKYQSLQFLLNVLLRRQSVLLRKSLESMNQFQQIVNGNLQRPPKSAQIVSMNEQNKQIMSNSSNNSKLKKSKTLDNLQLQTHFKQQVRSKSPTSSIQSFRSSQQQQQILQQIPKIFGDRATSADKNQNISKTHKINAPKTSFLLESKNPSQNMQKDQTIYKARSSDNNQLINIQGTNNEQKQQQFRRLIPPSQSKSDISKRDSLLMGNKETFQRLIPTNESVLPITKTLPLKVLSAGKTQQQFFQAPLNEISKNSQVNTSANATSSGIDLPMNNNNNLLFEQNSLSYFPSISKNQLIASSAVSSSNKVHFTKQDVTDYSGNIGQDDFPKPLQMIKSIREFQHHHNHQQQQQLPPIIIQFNPTNQQKMINKNDQETPSEGLPSQQSLASIEWQVDEIQNPNKRSDLPVTNSISQFPNNLNDLINKNNNLGIQTSEDNSGNINKNGTSLKKLARLSNVNVTQTIQDIENNNNNNSSEKNEDEEKEDNLICNYNIDNMKLSAHHELERNPINSNNISNLHSLNLLHPAYTFHSLDAHSLIHSKSLASPMNISSQTILSPSLQTPYYPSESTAVIPEEESASNGMNSSTSGYYPNPLKLSQFHVHATLQLLKNVDYLRKMLFSPNSLIKINSQFLSSVNLLQIVKVILYNLSSIVERKQLSVALMNAKKIDINLFTDKDKLSVLLFNLIQNALEAARCNSMISISFSNPNLSVNTFDEITNTPSPTDFNSMHKNAIFYQQKRESFSSIQGINNNLAARRYGKASPVECQSAYSGDNSNNQNSELKVSIANEVDANEFQGKILERLLEFDKISPEELIQAANTAAGSQQNAQNTGNANNITSDQDVVNSRVKLLKKKNTQEFHSGVSPRQNLSGNGNGGAPLPEEGVYSSGMSHRKKRGTLCNNPQLQLVQQYQPQLPQYMTQTVSSIQSNWNNSPQQQQLQQQLNSTSKSEQSSLSLGIVVSRDILRKIGPYDKISYSLGNSNQILTEFLLYRDLRHLDTEAPTRLSRNTVFSPSVPNNTSAQLGGSIAGTPMGNTTTFTALPEHKSKFCSTNNNFNNNSENGIFLNRSSNNYVGDNEKKLTIISAAEESSVNAAGSKKFVFIGNILSREIKETDIQGDLEEQMKISQSSLNAIEKLQLSSSSIPLERSFQNNSLNFTLQMKNNNFGF